MHDLPCPAKTCFNQFSSSISNSIHPPAIQTKPNNMDLTALSHLGIDIDDGSQWHINHVDHHDYSSTPAFAGDHNHSLSFPNYYSYFQTGTHAKQIKSDTPTTTWPNPQPASTLSFLHSSNPPMVPKQQLTAPKTTFPTDTLMITYPDSFHNHNHVASACKRAGGRSPVHTHHHIIAERKRREKLSQKFIALSAIIPGLKKMDKASVLGDAIRYLKQLQERVKLLEEQTSKKTTECVVLVNKSQLFADEDKSCSGDNEALPEIEARFCEKSVLIRIHCEKRKGAVEKTVEEIEKCHLSVINSSVMTFGSCALDITILAQMDMQFCLTAKDLVKNLRSALQLIMC